jgi:hypothetical protein
VVTQFGAEIHSSRLLLSGEIAPGLAGRLQKKAKVFLPHTHCFRALQVELLFTRDAEWRHLKHTYIQIHINTLKKQAAQAQSESVWKSLL